MGVEPHLSGRRGAWGRVAHDNRRFINAVIWILRTGAPWRDLPPEYGDWKNTHRRFCRWRDKGVWAKLFNMFVQDPDFEWLMIDASYIKVHPDATEARGGKSGYGMHKRGLNSKIHLAIDALGIPVDLTITSRTVADSSQADMLITSAIFACRQGIRYKLCS